MFDLSPRQRSILKWLLNWVRLIEQQHPELREIDITWMPEWQTKTGDKTVDKALENSFRASLSRSLARLKRRGLITRIKGTKKARTVSVMLTTEGRKIAEALSRY